MKILRIFPSRTSYTPRDPLIRIGYPDLFIPKVDEIHISCLFTWQKELCHKIYDNWAAQTNIPVKIGGPAFNDPGGPFIPGRYTKIGVSISSRGCPNNCSWCLVPKREGKLRLLPICKGNIIQDNNCLAFPRNHLEALFTMLRNEKRAIEFTGGLEAARLKDWHVDLFRSIRIYQIFLAADYDEAIKHVKRAAEMLRLKRRQMRCYVLIGTPGQTTDQAKLRLENVWNAGLLPFAQLFRDESGNTTHNKEWRDLARQWSRPALMAHAHAPDKLISGSKPDEAEEEDTQMAQDPQAEEIKGKGKAQAIPQG